MHSDPSASIPADFDPPSDWPPIANPDDNLDDPPRQASGNGPSWRSRTSDGPFYQPDRDNAATGLLGALNAIPPLAPSVGTIVESLAGPLLAEAHKARAAADLVVSHPETSERRRALAEAFRALEATSNPDAGRGPDVSPHPRPAFGLPGHECVPRPSAPRVGRDTA